MTRLIVFVQPVQFQWLGLSGADPGGGVQGAHAPPPFLAWLCPIWAPHFTLEHRWHPLRPPHFQILDPPLLIVFVQPVQFQWLGLLRLSKLLTVSEARHCVRAQPVYKYCTGWDWPVGRPIFHTGHHCICYPDSDVNNYRIIIILKFWGIPACQVLWRWRECPSRTQADCPHGKRRSASRSDWVLAGRDRNSAPAAYWPKRMQYHGSVVHTQGEEINSLSRAQFVIKWLTTGRDTQRTQVSPTFLFYTAVQGHTCRRSWANGEHHWHHHCHCAAWW